jgi:hypothetical protein
VALALDPALRTDRGLSAANRAIVAVVLVSIAVGVLETEVTLRDRFPLTFRAAELLCLAVFGVETLGRLYAAPENPATGGRLGFVLSPGGLIDLLVIVTLILPFVGLEASLLRFVRILRLLRLARLGRFSLAMELSIGVQSGALIGVRGGPLWREGSWPEAAQRSGLRSRLGPAFQPRSDAGLEARALVAGIDGEPLRRHGFEPHGERRDLCGGRAARWSSGRCRRGAGVPPAVRGRRRTAMRRRQGLR